MDVSKWRRCSHFFIQELFALYFVMSPMRIVDGDITIDKMLTLILRIWKYPSVKLFSALLAICVGKSPVTGQFPTQRPLTQSFHVSLICFWINGWVNNGDVGDLRHNSAHYDVKVMTDYCCCLIAIYKHASLFDIVLYQTLCECSKPMWKVTCMLKESDTTRVQILD